MKIPVLAYHSANIAGNEYHNNDHIAIRDDLETIHANGIKILSASDLVSWLHKKLTLNPQQQYVVLTFDDGVELDFIDWVHPEYGLQKSFYSNLINKEQTTHATCFVIASPTARAILEKTCMNGNPLMGERWWAEAEKSGIISIENHSWDHLHDSLEHVDQENNLKGDFSQIQTFQDANRQIGRSCQYINNILVDKKTTLFAYPYGHYNDYLITNYFPNQQSEIIAAFSCDPEHVCLSSNTWKIPRYVCGLNWKSSEEFRRDILLI